MHFPQLLQQVALGLISYKWHTELLTALATLDMWYLFRIIDHSDNKCVKFDVRESWSHEVDAPYFTPNVDGKPFTLSNVQGMDHLIQLVHFLARFLSTPGDK